MNIYDRIREAYKKELSDVIVGLRVETTKEKITFTWVDIKNGEELLVLHTLDYQKGWTYTLDLSEYITPEQVIKLDGPGRVSDSWRKAPE